MVEAELIDAGVVAALDAAAASDALAASRVRVLAAEAEQLFLAAHWADLHTPEYVAACEGLLPDARDPDDVAHEPRHDKALDESGGTGGTRGGRPDPADPADAGVPAWWLPDDESTRAGAEAERWAQHRIAARIAAPPT